MLRAKVANSYMKKMSSVSGKGAWHQWCEQTMAIGRRATRPDCMLARRVAGGHRARGGLHIQHHARRLCHPTFRLEIARSVGLVLAGRIR